MTAKVADNLFNEPAGGWEAIERQEGRETITEKVG